MGQDAGVTHGARHALCTPEGGEAEPVFRIGLAPVPLADWLEGGEADPAARKDALRVAHASQVWGAVAGSEAGQEEAAALIRVHLGLPAPDPADAAPLWSASRLVPDDLCLMERRAADHGEAWTLTAASLCAPSFFSAEEAVGRPLHALHAPVPGFNEHLLGRVARIFDRLAEGVILERRNWSVVNSPELFLPCAAPVRAHAGTLGAEALAATLTVRRERQTIRRLPRTGGVLFTIRIWREPLPDLSADPARRAAFAEAWARVMGDEGADFAGYKGLRGLDRAITPLLAGSWGR